MTAYSVVLYIHLLTFMGGVAASTLVHFGMSRLEQSQTVPEARQWHAMVGRVAKAFPAVVLLFFLTGAYMVAQKWTWQFGFVETGGIAAVLLVINGIIAGKRARALAIALGAAGDGPLTPALRAKIFDPVLQTLPWVNLAIVFGTVFVMTAKPTVTESLGVLLVAVVAGLVYANRRAARRKQSISVQAVERA